MTYLRRVVICKVAYLLLISLFLQSCSSEEKDLPEGYKIISQNKNFFFVLVSEEHWGDKYSQRKVGNFICRKNDLLEGYCEVLFFGDEKAIPKSFPIVNRTSPMGSFKLSYGERKQKGLPPPSGVDVKKKVMVFVKNIYDSLVFDANRNKAMLDE